MLALPAPISNLSYHTLSQTFSARRSHRCVSERGLLRTAYPAFYSQISALSHPVSFLNNTMAGTTRVEGALRLRGD